MGGGVIFCSDIEGITPMSIGSQVAWLSDMCWGRTMEVKGKTGIDKQAQFIDGTLGTFLDFFYQTSLVRLK